MPFEDVVKVVLPQAGRMNEDMASPVAVGDAVNIIANKFLEPCKGFKIG
jgi:hypothetical protein